MVVERAGHIELERLPDYVGDLTQKSILENLKGLLQLYNLVLKNSPYIQKLSGTDLFPRSRH